MTKRRTEKEPKNSRCPICSTPTPPGSQSFPFCSPRCRQIDLGRWLSGDYTISRPVEQRDLEEGVD